MEADGEIRLRDGRSITLRVAAPADVPRIAELYAGLSAGSFRRHFHSGRPKPVLLARLARIDVAPGTVSLVAITPGSERLAERPGTCPRPRMQANLPSPSSMTSRVSGWVVSC